MVRYLIAFTTMLVLFIAGCSSLDQEAKLVPSSEEAEKEMADGGSYELISVKMSDESKFSKEEWKKVLKQIETGEIILEAE